MRQRDSCVIPLHATIICLLCCDTTVEAGEDWPWEHVGAGTRSTSQQTLETNGQTGSWEKVNDYGVLSICICRTSHNLINWNHNQRLLLWINYCPFCWLWPRILQEKLDQPVSAPPSPRDVSMEIDSPENMMRHIRFLKNEVERLKKSLRTTELQRKCPF